MASLVGPQRRHRRPLLAGVGVALAASVVTWIVAQTVLGSLAGWGERLEAVVSLIAIAVLLLILNWFYHRVYWQENLQDLHRRKRRILVGGSVGLLSAQAIGLVLLGFSSVYREGFETVLFLQALTLEAGAWTVLQGVLLGFAAVVGVFFLVIALERRASAQEDARCHGGADHLGARDPRRSDRADDAGRRLGVGDADPGAPAPVLVGRLVRAVPDVGGAHRPVRGRALRRRQLRRGRGGSQTSPAGGCSRVSSRAWRLRRQIRRRRASGRREDPDTVSSSRR